MIEVRKLRRDDDLSQVLALCHAFFADYESHHAEFFDTDNLTEVDIAGRFVDSIDSETSATLTALVDGSVVGYALLMIREQPRFYKVKRVGAISGLMVAPEFRRRGIGTRLMAGARSFFAEHDVKYYTFYTAVGNTGAIALYERLGIPAIQTVFLGET